MTEQWIVIPKWDKLQHRDAWRSRVPTWICEYTEQTSHEAYLTLSLVQRGILHGLRLEYARSRSQLSASTTSLARRLGVRQILQRDLEALNHAGFIEFSASRPARDTAGEPDSKDARLEDRREELPPNPPTGKRQKRTAKPEDREQYEAELPRVTCRYCDQTFIDLPAGRIRRAEHEHVMHELYDEKPIRPLEEVT